MITSRHWERNYSQLGISNALVSGAAQQTSFTSDTLGLTNPTVLRSRFFPQFSANITASSNLHDRAAVQLTVQFMAWADQIVPSPIPDMLSVDERVIATGFLTPHYKPSPTNPTTVFAMTWDVDGGVIESKGQRMTDPANTNPLTVYTAIYPIDWTFYWYTGRAAQEFTYYTAAEVLLGGH